MVKKNTDIIKTIEIEVQFSKLKLLPSEFFFFFLIANLGSETRNRKPSCLHEVHCVLKNYSRCEQTNCTLHRHHFCPLVTRSGFISYEAEQPEEFFAKVKRLKEKQG